MSNILFFIEIGRFFFFIKCSGEPKGCSLVNLANWSKNPMLGSEHVRLLRSCIMGHHWVTSVVLWGQQRAIVVDAMSVGEACCARD